MIYSQTPGNLFSLHKLKGNHTFTTQAVTIGNAKDEADPDVKEEGEGEIEPLVDKEVKVSGRADGTDQSMKCIIHFAKVVKLYQQKSRSCFRYRSPNHLVQDCPKDN